MYLTKNSIGKWSKGFILYYYIIWEMNNFLTLKKALVCFIFQFYCHRWPLYHTLLLAFSFLLLCYWQLSSYYFGNLFRTNTSYQFSKLTIHVWNPVLSNANKMFQENFNTSFCSLILWKTVATISLFWCFTRCWFQKCL